MKGNTAVVIPVYTLDLSREEQASIEQCLSVLGKYNMILVCPDNLFIDNWVHLDRFEIERFDQVHFQSVEAYSRLLLSAEFYHRFIEYEYILIYQVDAWVFRDELKEWISKDYDYIGAPWFTYGTHDHIEGELWKVGNGGFSLRKVSSHLAVLNSGKKVLSLDELWEKHRKYMKKSFFIALVKTGLQYLGYRNRLRTFLSEFKLNEDFFWGIEAQRFLPGFSVAGIEEALPFSFECDPEYLFKKNGNKLPFGCHAWEKWGKEFWLDHIKIDNE